MFSFARNAIGNSSSRFYKFGYKCGNCVLISINQSTKVAAPINRRKLSLDTNFKLTNKIENFRNITTFATKNSKTTKDNNSVTMENKSEKINVNKEELKKRLTPLQYQVTQEAATERPFTGCYNKHYEKGVYQCIVCHQDLFSSDTKYDSGCGWPAFNDVLDKGKVTLHRDASIPGGNILLLIANPDRVRTEVRCARCSAHMGHVFEDGPKPTRKRYCINSASIEFVTPEQLNAASGTTTTAAAAPHNVVTGTPIAQQ